MNSLINNIKQISHCPTFKAHYCYHLFKMYNTNDWKLYNYYKKDDFYRITIHRDNKFQLMLINWKKDYYTDFHNHPMNGCMLKVLKGSLLEYKKCDSLMTNSYNQPTSNDIIMVSQLKQNSISYNTYNEVHKIIAVEDSVSLHLYSPPI
jgi:hypothetical protein